MITFVLLAATFTVAGAIAVAVPLLRRGALEPASWAALGVGVLGLGRPFFFFFGNSVLKLVGTCLNSP